MQLGVSYPGVVWASDYRYYSLYLDAALLRTSAYLSIGLTSLSLYPELFVSTLPYPTRTTARWSSTLRSALSYNSVVLTAAQLGLNSTTIYCSVGTSFAGRPAFLLSASYGQLTGLSPTEPTLAVGSGLFSYDFEGNSTRTSPYVSVSVVAVSGQTAVFMQPYGRVPSPTSYLWSEPTPSAQQFALLPTAAICGPSFVNAIPGSSPLLCQLNVAVFTQSASDVYRISVSSASDVVPLIAGAQVEGAATVGYSSTYSFVIPDNLSNVTLLVFVTSDASDVTLTVGTRDASSLSALRTVLWTAQQEPGNPFISLVLDFTNPLLPSRGYIQGEYGLVVSSQQKAAFTVTYTLTNRTGYAGTIVPLVDGVPEPAVVQTGDYAFFFFGPLPLEGWPYTVTFTVDVVSGVGEVSVAATDGTAFGPLPGDAGVTRGTPLQINPTSASACQPNATTGSSGLPCGYSLSVVALRGPVQCTVTAVTGKYVRNLALVNHLNEGILQPGGADYYVQSVNTYIPPTVTTGLVRVSVDKGSVVVYLSNTTRAPNASQAQYSLVVDTVDLLQLPIAYWSSPTVYYTVQCTGSIACQYGLRTDIYVPGPSRALTRGSTATAAILAGDILNLYVSLRGITSLAFVTLQVQPLLDTQNVFVRCGASDTDRVNETSATWSATGPWPLLLEITDLPVNLTAASCNWLLIGVRATGVKASLTAVSVAFAGLQSTVTQYSNAFGLLTPAYPVTYIAFTVVIANPTTVLAWVVSASLPSCLATLQLLVSSTVIYPSAAQRGVTYDFLGSAEQLDVGLTDLSVAITNSTLPAGSLHTGLYYLAVVNTAATTCEFTVQGVSQTQTALLLGQVVYSQVSRQAVNFFSLNAPANTALSFAAAVPVGRDTTRFYVGVNSSPVPSDPSTYLLVRSVDASQLARPAPIYIPATLCTVAPCNVLILLVTNTSDVRKVGVQTASSEGAVRLTDSQPFAGQVHAMVASGTRYQFSLPTAPRAVSVSVTATSPVDVACSYQYVQPDASLYDWVSNSSAMVATPAVNYTTTLTFTWADLLVNPATSLAMVPTSCYCSLIPLTHGLSPTSFVISFSSA